jgi:hypothetical protein
VSDTPRIAYRKRADAAPDGETMTLANIYRFVISCQAKKEAAPESRPDDGNKVQGDSADAPSIRGPMRS